MKAEIKILFDRQINITKNNKVNIPIIGDIIIHTSDNNKYILRFNTCLIESYKNCICKYILEDFDTTTPGSEFIINSLDKIDDIVSVDIDTEFENINVDRAIPLLITNFDICDIIHFDNNPSTTEFVEVSICKIDEEHKFARYSLTKKLLNEYIFNYPMKIIGATLNYNNIDVKVNSVFDNEINIIDMINIIKENAKQEALDVLSSANSKDFSVNLIEAVIDDSRIDEI